MSEKTAQVYSRASSTASSNAATNNAAPNNAALTPNTENETHNTEGGDHNTAGGDSKSLEGVPNTDSIEPNYQAIAIAVVEQAIKDYNTVLESLYVERDPRTRIKLFARKAEIESFFNSDWYEALTDLDPKYLLSRTREIAMRSIKQMIRQRHRKEGRAGEGRTTTAAIAIATATSVSLIGGAA